MTFQQIIETLNSFWASHGCIIAQPYGIEVGAGTANPHTFFRVLGPEPYNVAYVEPSRRPTDGRYGKNPNRLQHYYQYQVILKPAPKFNQELYLESLNALGIDITKHDIRFVEDNWESTPLGAWGLGWEVWLDGMEVSQYTYFQQVAGIPLEVPALEITYGLERLAMYIQDVDDYRKVKWNQTTSYGDIFEQHEFWQATYNYQTATIDSLHKLFDIYNNEVKIQLDAGNYWSGYDYILKLSHVFNLLDSRGVISVSDRIAKFGMIAKYSKIIGQLYLVEREKLNYPLLKSAKTVKFILPEVTVSLQTKNQPENIAIVEIGLEEVPATYLSEWSTILTNEWLHKSLETNELIFDKAVLGITPRRIVLQVYNPKSKIEYSEVVTGPMWDIAFKDDQPTPILEGFLKKYDANIKNIEKVFKNEKPFIGIKRTVIITLRDVLQKTITDLLATAPKTKLMKWEAESAPFIRPIRWLFAMHNEKIIPLSIQNTRITSTTNTYSPRYLAQQSYNLSSAQQYLVLMHTLGISLDTTKRIERVTVAEVKSHTLSPKYQDYVTQTAFLTESPEPKMVKLPERYHILPPELITSILEKNQMYLLSYANNEIYYTIVANAEQTSDMIIDGNARVVKARLEDGLFYLNLDKDTTLHEFRKRLISLTYHPKLGSYFVKTERIAAISAWILSHINQPKGVTELVEAALPLIKNDRASNLVKEFTGLEGIIGYYYAKRDGITEDVANILKYSLKPELATDNIKSQVIIASKIIALADVIDSFVGLSTVEGVPRGSHDPFEIRKNAAMIIQLLSEENNLFSFSLKELISYSGNFVKAPSEILGSLELFILERAEQYFIDVLGLPAWIASGVIRSTENSLQKKTVIANQLAKLESSEQIKENFLDSLKRVQNVLKGENLLTRDIDDSLLETDSEKELFALVNNLQMKDASERIKDFKKISGKLETFFKETRISVDNQKTKMNRIALLQTVKDLLAEIFVLSFAE